MIHKPFLESLDVPQKIWAWSVHPFWRLLDTNRQTDKPNLYIDCFDPLLRYATDWRIMFEFQETILIFPVDIFISVLQLQLDSQNKLFRKYKMSENIDIFLKFTCLRIPAPPLILLLSIKTWFFLHPLSQKHFLSFAHNIIEVNL